MRLIEVDESIMHDGRVYRSVWESLMNEFIASGMKIAEVTDYDVQMSSAYNAIKVYIRRHSLPLAVTQRKGHIYIIRKDNVEE